jgi:hypothetical protein
MRIVSVEEALQNIPGKRCSPLTTQLLALQPGQALHVSFDEVAYERIQTAVQSVRQKLPSLKLSTRKHVDGLSCYILASQRTN